MATFSVLVTSSSIDSQSAHSAYRFALAIEQSEHNLAGVFFYQAGVHNSNALQTNLNDEPHLLSMWQDLVKEFNTPLYVCVTAANKRGIAEPVASTPSLQTNLSAVFQVAGLGEMIQLSNQSDRMVQF